MSTIIKCDRCQVEVHEESSDVYKIVIGHYAVGSDIGIIRDMDLCEKCRTDLKVTIKKFLNIPDRPGLTSGPPSFTSRKNFMAS